MPLEPKPAEFPRIRGALKFYMVCSAITGVMLLLLSAEMVLKYAFLVEVFAFGPNGLLSLEPVVETPEGLESTGVGVNLSTGILIAHGWFYVVYLFSCFRVWSLMRWPFWRLLLLASGGIVPTLSFFLEARTAREVREYLAKREADATTGSLSDERSDETKGDFVSPVAVPGGPSSRSARSGTGDGDTL